MGLSTGCIFGLGGGDPTDPTQLEGCAPAGADIDAHVQISLDFQQSMHELVVCGGLTIKVSVAASEALYQLIFASAVNALPPEFSYQGDGLYRTGDASTDMGLGFVFGADYEVGGRGELITENLFVLDSYLVNAQATADATGVTITYDAPGPLVELLGLGASPQNPLVLTSADALTISTELNKIKVRGTVRVDDDREGTDVAYDVDLSPSPIVNLLLPFGQLDFDVVDASASRGALSQQLDVSSWGVHYTDGLGLEGTVAFAVGGGEFDYVGALEYTSGGYGDLRLECP